MCYSTHTDDSPTCCDFKDKSRYIELPCGEYLLDLIRYQKAEIESQKAEIERLSKETADKERAYNEEFCLRKEYKLKSETAKREAYKEFAARLLDYTSEVVSNGYDGISEQDIEEILEEMLRYDGE